MNHATSDEAALDQALARALEAPSLPPGFRSRLRAAMERVGDTDLAARRRRLEREQRDLQQILQSDSIQLRWWTLGYLIGGAFVAGIGITIGMPWIRATFGANGDIVILGSWAGVSLVIGGVTWVRRYGLPQWMS